MFSEKMTGSERRAVGSLATIMSLRMIGLFMVTPVFSIYAQQLAGATPLLIGLAMGIYGLSQAFLQIPFGMLSDKFGRKPIIFMGLLLFAGGSLIAATADSITWLIIGRILQGAGAIGSTLLALMSDVTRESQRTKAMAIAGISIGFSFSLSIILGPALIQWIGIPGLFLLAIGMSGLAILLLFSTVPTPVTLSQPSNSAPELKAFKSVFFMPELIRLNTGIFILHAIFTASFIAIPLSLITFANLQPQVQWWWYMPTLLTGLCISLIGMGAAEKSQKLKPYFLAGIITIIIAELCIWFSPINKLFLLAGLTGFFAGFSLLESFLPSLVSRSAPASRKGTALGIYSCAQFLGIFTGGVLGGWLYGHFSFSGVYLFCIVLGSIWLTLALLMQPPRYIVTQMWRLLPAHQDQWRSIAAKLQLIPGIIEVTLIPEDNMAYLKMERKTTQHPDFIRLKEQLQSE